MPLSVFKDLANSLLDAFYGSLHIPPDASPLTEPFCQCCAQPFEGLAQHTQFCFNCKGVKWRFRRVRAPFLLEGNVQEFIHEYKYRGEHWLRRYLGECMHQAYHKYYSQAKYTAIVPVPLSPARLKERGFNQARELASYLSHRTGIPLLDCLRRKRDNQSQAGLTRAMRIRNSRNLFQVIEKFLPLAGDYILIDDVVTTGSTCSACASALLSGGASAVDVLAVARA
jgi:ComF family protein